MANNYTQFSSNLIAPPEALDWLEKALNGEVGPEDDLFLCRDDEECYGPPCSLKRTEPTELWVYSEEDADLQEVAFRLAQAQKKFNLAEPFSVSWADTCSKPRVNEFGGGAFVAHKGGVTWHTCTLSWIEGQISLCKKLLAAPLTTHEECVAHCKDGTDTLSVVVEVSHEELHTILQGEASASQSWEQLLVSKITPCLRLFNLTWSLVNIRDTSMFYEVSASLTLNNEKTY